MTGILSNQFNINIHKLSVTTKDGIFDCEIQLGVHDVEDVKKNLQQTEEHDRRGRSDPDRLRQSRPHTTERNQTKPSNSFFICINSSRTACRRPTISIFRSTSPLLFRKALRAAASFMPFTLTKW